jgi:photosystem II stability/assembly factor-like uncharacterized protein
VHEAGRPNPFADANAFIDGSEGGGGGGGVLAGGGSTSSSGGNGSGSTSSSGGGPVNWKSFVGGTGVFGQTFDDQTWSVKTITNGTIFSVTCSGNQHGWASGEQGWIAHTDDGGQSWSTQSSQVGASLRAIRFGSLTMGVAAGDQGALTVTSDGGAHWRAVTPSPAQVTFRGATVAGDVGVMLVAGDAGTIARSGDAGGSWTSFVVPGAGDFRGVASDTAARVVVAVDTLGAIWRSTDAGQSFVHDTTAPVPLDAVAVTDDGTLTLIAGHTGLAWLQAGQGAWRPLTTGTTVDLHASLITDSDGRFYLAGEAGVLLTSVDGASWARVPLQTTAPIYGLEDL